jgi:hypothetical protein
LPLCFLPVRLERELKDPDKLDKNVARASIVVLTSAETVVSFSRLATRASAFFCWSSTEFLRALKPVNKVTLNGQVQSLLYMG